MVLVMTELYKIYCLLRSHVEALSDCVYMCIYMHSICLDCIYPIKVYNTLFLCPIDTWNMTSFTSEKSQMKGCCLSDSSARPPSEFYSHLFGEQKQTPKFYTYCPQSSPFVLKDISCNVLSPLTLSQSRGLPGTSAGTGPWSPILACLCLQTGI